MSDSDNKGGLDAELERAVAQHKIEVIPSPRPEREGRAAWDDGIASQLGKTHGDDYRRHEYVECDSCRAKPGSPTLCYGCLANRTTIGDLRVALAEALDQWQNWVDSASPNSGPLPPLPRIVELRKLIKP